MKDLIVYLEKMTQIAKEHDCFIVNSIEAEQITYEEK